MAALIRELPGEPTAVDGRGGSPGSPVKRKGFQARRSWTLLLLMVPVMILNVRRFRSERVAT